MANAMYDSVRKRLLELASQPEPKQTLFAVSTAGGFELRPLPDHRSAEGPERSD